MVLATIPSPTILATISFMEVQEKQIDTCLHCSMHIYTCTDGQIFSIETIHMVHQSPATGPTGLICIFCSKSLLGLCQ